MEDIKRTSTGMSDEQQQNKNPQEEEIDLLELALKVWAERRWILKCCGYAVFPCGCGTSERVNHNYLFNTL